jgi:prolyl-tRNA synthetase
MKQSMLFQKTTKDISKEEVSLNAQLLLRAGFINKLMAGAYSYLPMGIKTIANIEKIVREEMNAIGGQEILMPALQPKEIWDQTQRWDMDVLYKLKGHGDSDLALGPTHEEVVTPLAQTVISSYKDMPVAAYQIQTKFRNEARAKSGILRGREFKMKDLYSFHESQECLDAFYEKATQAYHKVFARCGLGNITKLTYADGGAFSKYSHEFQTLSKSGEDTIYLVPGTDIAINKEIIDDKEALASIIPNYKDGDEKNLKTAKAIETGNIFKLGTKFSGSFNMNVQGKDGKPVTPIMGCYGIGISRLMGTIAECLSDDKGLVWPTEIAPYKAHIIPIVKSYEDNAIVENVYTELNKAGLDTLLDDRAKLSVGAKLADADLLGMPFRLVISAKTLADNSAELTIRQTGDVKMVKLADILPTLQKLMAK